MAVSDHMRPGLGPRFMVKILTVDPSTRKIEAALKDSGLIHVAVFDTPEVFVWPQVGEYWTVRKESGIWMLDKRVNARDEHTVNDLNPGEAKIHADVIRDLSGNAVVTVNDEEIDQGQVLTYLSGKWSAEDLPITSVSIGDVTTGTEPSVINSGTSKEVVLDFVFPAGGGGGGGSITQINGTSGNILVSNSTGPIVTIDLPNVGTSDYYTKVQTDAKGRVISGSGLSSSDIPTITYSKLNISNSITNSDIASNASIDLSKLAANPLARSNHTGTQTASTISDFDTQVQTSASTTNPNMDGLVAIGTSLKYARADHVHPTDTSRAPTASPTFTGTVNAVDVSISGDLTVSGTTTIIDTTNLKVKDQNIEINNSATPSASLDGSGITILGGTSGNKTFQWSNTNSALTTNSDISVASGQTYKIGSTTVLSSTQIFGRNVGTDSNATDLVDRGTAQTLTNKIIGVSQLSGQVSVANGGTGVSSLGTGVVTFLGTPSSANLASALTDKTGSSGGGVVVFSNSPSLTSPSLGAATATTINGLTITSSTGALTVANGKTLTANNSIALTGTDGTTMTFPSTSATMARTDTGQTFTGTNTFNNTITGSITGNAGTATTLQTARTINGVSFNGSANVNINAATSTWMTVHERAAPITTNNALARYILGFGVATTEGTANTAGGMIVYIDPADYTATGYTAKFRLRNAVLVNRYTTATTAGISGVYPVQLVDAFQPSTANTAIQIDPFNPLTTVAPAASIKGTGVSGGTGTATYTSSSFTISTAGYYVITYYANNNLSASSGSIAMQISSAIQVRYE